MLQQQIQLHLPKFLAFIYCNKITTIYVEFLGLYQMKFLLQDMLVGSSEIENDMSNRFPYQCGHDNDV